MAYTLTLNSIYPTTVEQKNNIGLIINYTLSGSGFGIMGSTITLYDRLTGGSIIKTLYYDDYELVSGNAVYVSFADVSPGTYYVDLHYLVQGTPRKEIVVTGGSSAVRNITINGTTVTYNSLDNVAVTNETVNGTKVYG